MVEGRQKVKKSMKNQPTISHHVDSPRSWELDQPEVIISGWCFADEGPPLEGIRVQVGPILVEGTYGLERPDVATAHPKSENAGISGFLISTFLPSGERGLLIQAKDHLGRWHVLEHRMATVPLAPLAAHFDTPPNAVTHTGTIRFSGWCCHPQHRIQYLKIMVHGVPFECRHAIGREDVGRVYPNWPGSFQAGFEVSCPLRPGRGEVCLEARLEDGTRVVFQGFPNLVVKPQPWRRRFTRRLRQTHGMVQYMAKLAHDRRRRLGRGPRLREIPLLAREVRTAFTRWQGSHKSGDYALPQNFEIPPQRSTYDCWVELNRWRPRAESHLRTRLGQASHSAPLFSVVMPVYNPPEPWFSGALQSVLDQVYPNWELCLANDASPDPNARALLRSWAQKDARIRITHREKNGGISQATNSAASLARGDFIVLLDQDDELTPDALAELALYLAQHPQADVVYSDDDKIRTDGKRFDPQFKPDWSPELLLSFMYFSHVFCLRRSLFGELGGARVGFEGSQDFDLALRATERARHVGHIPKILYHWRVLPGSTAASADEKPASIQAGLRAVRSALDRRGIEAEAVHPSWAAEANVGIFTPRFGHEGPSVTIIIPTKNQQDLLGRCLSSLEKTTYRNFRVLILDNESDDPETLEFLKQQPHPVLKIANPGSSFNFAYINNQAVESVATDFVLFLNNDTEVIEPDWLSQMMGYGQMEGVGAVGARLLYPDGRVQHAGIVHGYYHGLAGPAFKLHPSWHHGYLCYVSAARNYSAVTAACMLTTRALFCEMGGFDAKNFGVAYNDVDFCYRLIDRGYRCVYCPEAKLYHHEGFSRGFADNPMETAFFKLKYHDRVDRYYNPNLSLANEAFEIRPGTHCAAETAPIPALMCAFNLNWEGAPYSQFELTLKLKEMGVIAPIVYCPQDGPLREAYEREGIPIHVFPHPLTGVETLEDFEQAIAAFAARIEEWGVELVYGNTLQTFYAIEAAYRLGLPSIWNPRESEPWQTYFSDWSDSIAARALSCFGYPYKVVFVAEATRQGYAELAGKHNFSVIHNGLNMERLKNEARRYTRQAARNRLGAGEEDICILLLGTVCERKGQKDLIAALGSMFEEELRRIQVFIVGDRPSLYSDELTQRRDRLAADIRDRVAIIQETPDTPLYYNAADIFVCTSRLESYPRVILEAMAYGLPIITTPVFGISEQVQENINGLFYQPGDTAALAAALTELVRDAGKRSRMARNSPYVLDILNSYEDMARDYARVFREAWLAGRGPPLLSDANQDRERLNHPLESRSMETR